MEVEGGEMAAGKKNKTEVVGEKNKKKGNGEKEKGENGLKMPPS